MDTNQSDNEILASYIQSAGKNANDVLTQYIQHANTLDLTYIGKLILQGANPTIRVNGTPLLWYVIMWFKRESIELVNILLNAHVSIEEPPFTPILLHMAEYDCPYHVYQVIAMGASLFEVDHNGNTALHLFIYKRINLDVIRAFVTKDALICLTRNEKGHRPQDILFDFAGIIKELDGPFYELFDNTKRQAKESLLSCLSIVMPISVLVSLIYDYL